ncbi:MAG: CPBP family intramembrane glutamic endopeptidase [Terracidiphilus sp.]
MTEDERIDASEASQVEPAQRVLAPAWHTALLIAGILAISIAGKLHMAGLHRGTNRLLTYGTTAALEVVMLGWVAVGLRLSRTPLRSMLGSLERGVRGAVRDIAIAAAFWIGSLIVLSMLGLAWTGVETAVKVWHAPQGSRAGALVPRHEESLRAIEQLAPENGVEIASWILLCCLAGTIEEVVFRGYLQRQFTAWAKGIDAWGVVFSALLFGAAHGYQGARNMFLLAAFGVLFSVLALLRRSLRAGIFAHSWHDLITGLILTLLRAHHLV